MKIATFAALAASLFVFATPSAEARSMRHHSSHHMMMHGHHRMHMMGRSGGRMPASHNF